MSNRRYALRLIKGGYAPADATTAAELRQMHRVGDLVFAEFRLPRNPRFNRLAHALGGLIAENIEAFHGMDSHTVLKRLQIESNVGCDEISLVFPELGPCTYRVPRSLSFASMDEGAFRTVMQGLCEHVSNNYWPSVSPERVEAMAEAWLDEAG